MMTAGATSGGSFLLLLFSLTRWGKYNAAFGGDAMTEDKINEVAADSKYADPEEEVDPSAGVIAGVKAAEAETAAETPAATPAAEPTGAVEPDNTTPAGETAAPGGDTAADPWNSGSQQGWGGWGNL